MVMNVLIGGAAVYGLMVGGLWLMQDSMIFPRRSLQESRYPLPNNTERMTLTTDDGETLIGNLVRARGRSRGLLIGFSGNAWQADDCTAFTAHRLHDVDLALFHYRGYEPSSGRPSQEALFADALLIYDTLVKGLEPERVWTIGYSIGSGVATYLASQRRIDGQILVTPFDSIAAIGKARYGFIPVRQLLRHPFDSISYARELATPTAVILAENDSIVPPRHSLRLVEALRRPVLVETVDGATHGGIYDRDEIDHLMRRALKALEEAVESADGKDAVPPDRPSETVN